MQANEHQVGGTHYCDTSVQLWDFVYDHGIDWLSGNAIKYILRWRKKHGFEDLNKAIHYTEKLLEKIADCNFPVSDSVRSPAPVELIEFSVANKLSPDEQYAISLLATWKTEEQVMNARTRILQIRDDAKKVNLLAVPAV